MNFKGGPGRKGGNPDGIVGKHGKRKVVSEQQQAFKRYYLADPTNATEAARRAGYKNPATMGVKLRDPKYYPVLAAEISLGMCKKEETALLKAEQILQRVHSVIEADLTKWFLPGGDGGWLVDEEDLGKLPPEVGKMIECVEKREITVEGGGKKVRRVMFWVKIISKTKCLEIAAKHQLGERHEHVFTQVNWEAMYRRTTRPPDPVEERRVRVLATGAKALPPGDNGGGNGEGTSDE